MLRWSLRTRTRIQALVVLPSVQEKIREHPLCAQAHRKGDLGKWKSERPNTKAGGNFQLPDPQSRSPAPCLVTTTHPSLRFSYASYFSTEIHTSPVQNPCGALAGVVVQGHPGCPKMT